MNKESILLDIIGRDFASTVPKKQIKQILNTFMEDLTYHSKYFFLFDQDDQIIAHSYNYQINMVMKGSITIDKIQAIDISFTVTVKSIRWTEKDLLIMNKDIQLVIISSQDIWKISGSGQLTDYSDTQITMKGTGYIINH